MKANEAPEKLYFGERDKGVLDIYSTKESDNEVEYTRTDAFIENACEFMRNNIDKQLTIYHDNTWRKRDEFIEAFRQFMKGEKV